MIGQIAFYCAERVHGLPISNCSLFLGNVWLTFGKVDVFKQVAHYLLGGAAEYKRRA